MKNRNLLERLRMIVEENDLCTRTANFRDRFSSAIQNPEIREILEIETPQVADLTSNLPVMNGGKVYAVRYDLTKNVDNHKKETVAGLILRQILLRNLPSEKRETLIDGGSVNTALAEKYYVHKFGLHGIHVMSRYFPDDITQSLETGRFHIIRAKKDAQFSLEREFYSYLLSCTKKSSFDNTLGLWHAKHGGEVIYPLGKEIARLLPKDLEFSVSCVGAGSTLEGTQLAINDYFIEQGIKPPKVFINEHEKSALFAKEFPDKIRRIETLSQLPYEEIYRQVQGLPHLVAGPHFVERNPLIKPCVLQRIEGIVQYSEQDWKGVQQYLAKQEISVGNSSAANLSVAVRLANQGKKVLTFIFEPFREFYRGNN
ncbi:MAG: hypothetical protein AABX11_07625 [Nanoarchaeota archaeon]